MNDQPYNVVKKKYFHKNSKTTDNKVYILVSVEIETNQCSLIKPPL